MPRPSKKDIATLVKISRQYGSDPSIVLAGGGNTSVKTDDCLLVKASGHALATIDEGGFVEMDRGKLARAGLSTRPRDAAPDDDLDVLRLGSRFRGTVRRNK